MTLPQWDITSWINLSRSSEELRDFNHTPTQTNEWLANQVQERANKMVHIILQCTKFLIPLPISEEIGRLKHKISELLEENNTLKEENKQLHRDLKSSDESIKGLWYDNEQLEAEIRRWQEKLDEAHKFVHRKDTVNRTLRSMLGEIHAELKNSMIDQLTGVLNRQSFEHKASNKMNTLSREWGAMSLLLIDIDNFKHINDSYGHLAWDKVLTYLWELLSNNIWRENDVVWRYWWEEFVALLPETDLKWAEELWEKLREAIELDLHKSLSWKIKESEPITWSIWIYSTYIKKGNQFKEIPNILEECIAKADEALYKAKKWGRNRVEIYEEK